uniref:Uncharacterized protein n=1 Tax=mine drainage metagenome TaxID=410659 RepID=E6QS52_9ZZZZ
MTAPIFPCLYSRCFRRGTNGWRLLSAHATFRIHFFDGKPKWIGKIMERQPFSCIG